MAFCSAARISRFDRTQDVIVAALLARTEHRFGVLRRVVERFHYIEVELEQRVQHRGEHGLMRRSLLAVP